MKRSKKLAERLEEVLLNGHWIANTNYLKELESVYWELAIKKVNALNSIAALTFHVNYYLAGIINVFKGGELEIRDKYSFDLPEITSPEDWSKLVNDLKTNSKNFIEETTKLSDEILDTSFVKEDYGTYERNIEGVIEHCYYHLGQIVIIKKILKQ